MAARLPDGATVSIATTYGTPVAISSISNSSPGVAAAPANGFANGDLVTLVAGWSNLNNKVVRVAGAATNAFNLDGIDTTSAVLYPGVATGTATKITAFQQITQIMGFSTSGGDQQFANFSFLEQNFETQIPTITSAMSIALEIADDPSLPGYIALKAAADSRAIRALKIQMPDGSFILYQGYVSFNETPTVSKGQIMLVKATFSLQARPVRYAS